jgi:CheY-like chemotaxis protein
MGAVHKVLVVDDDPVIAKSFHRVLSTKGYAVITVENGAEALKKLASEEYDVVYTDIRMPGMSGLEVAEQVKAQRPWTPVVIITGYGDAEHEARARKAGVAAFLNKPLSPDMIEESAIAALRKAGAAVPQETAPAEPGRGGLGRSIGTLASAALGGLAFVIAFPVVALAALAWLAMREWGKHEGLSAAAQRIGNVVLLLAAPFVSAALMAVMPMSGGYALMQLAKKSTTKEQVKRDAHALVGNIGATLASPLTRITGRDNAFGRLVAAPFIAVAYLGYPAAAIGVFLWAGVQAWIEAPAVA